MTDDVHAAAPAAQVRLPGGVTEAALRRAVAESRSWRGVLRSLGMSAPRNGRVMRAACDQLGIAYDHFSGTQWDKLDPRLLAESVAVSSSWGEVMARLGYAARSGSARASLRRAALELGIDVAHLGAGALSAGGPFAGVPDDRNLRRGAALLVAAKCTFLGHGVSWPLEPQPYDLLVHTQEQGVLRVQVKSSTHFAGASWIVRLSKERSGPRGRQRVPYTSDDVDYFGIVDAEQQVYMLPIAAVAGKTAVSLRTYDAYRLAS